MVHQPGCWQQMTCRTGFKTQSDQTCSHTYHYQRLHPQKINGKNNTNKTFRLWARFAKFGQAKKQKRALVTCSAARAGSVVKTELHRKVVPGAMSLWSTTQARAGPSTGLSKVIMFIHFLVCEPTSLVWHRGGLQDMHLLCEPRNQAGHCLLEDA